MAPSAPFGARLAPANRMDKRFAPLRRHSLFGHRSPLGCRFQSRPGTGTTGAPPCKTRVFQSSNTNIVGRYYRGLELAAIGHPCRRGHVVTLASLVHVVTVV